MTRMNPVDLEGKVYGPVPWRVAVDAVTDFVEVTGDDQGRWTESAPPGFAAAALFSVAPDLLDELFDRSVIHGEQSFVWHAPLSVGGLLDVTGTVTRVRERGGVFFITFEMRAEDVLSGKSVFLVSDEAIPGGESGFDRQEPPHSYAGAKTGSQVSASRSDLIRYAAATRDWNPVHWDHDAAVAAGFPGVVVHGLLQAAWALRVALSSTHSDRPVADGRFRFRNPLLPARPADVSLEINGLAARVVLADDDVEYLTANLTLADE